MKKLAIVLFSFAMLAFAPACEDKNKAEKAGEKVEEAGENAAEAVEEAAEKAEDKAEEAAH